MRLTKTIQMLVVLFCLMSSNVKADNFTAWWPWIYARCNSTTNGTNAWNWVILNSNVVNYVKTHTNLWDQCLTNGFLSASNDWAVVKVGNRFRLDYDTNTASGGTNAWNWITANSNSFNYMTGQTSKWDASWAWVDNYAEGYTNVIAWTSNWNDAWAWVDQFAEGYTNVTSWTNDWNSSWAWIQNYAPGYTNLIGWTNNWNASWAWIDAYAEGYTNLIGWTNSWNDSWTWVDYHAEGYTNVIGWTNDWNGSWTWIQNYAPGYTNLIGWTNNWNRSWDWVDFYAEGYTNLIGWTNAWNFIAANGATNAGAAGGPMYAMSNLQWTAFTPGAGSGTGDVMAAGDNVMSGSNTFTGPIMVGTNLWIGTVPTQVTAVVVADGALTPDADTLDGFHATYFWPTNSSGLINLTTEIDHTDSSGNNILTNPADWGRSHVCSDDGSAADYTLTLPTATNNAGKVMAFRMASALTKLVTLDGNASELIDGETTRVLWANETATLQSTGTGWAKIAGKTIPMMAYVYRNGTETMTNGVGRFININLAVVDIGSMASTATYRIIPRRSGYYNVSGALYCSPGVAVPRLISACWNTGILAHYGQDERGVYSTTTYPCSFFSSVRYVPAGELMGLNVYQNSGGTLTLTGTQANPSFLCVEEKPAW